MPAHLDKPTAEHVIKFAERMKTRWSNQDTLDDLMVALVTMKDRELTIPQWEHGNEPGKAKPSGLPYVVWRENARLLKTDPAWRIPVPDDLKDLREHADSVLEPFLDALWHRQIQDEPWWDSCTDDYPLLGRAWAFTSHVPDRWADEKIRALTKELSEAEKEEDIQRINGQLYKLKQGKIPLRTRYVDPKKTYTTFESEHWCPQVVEVRELDRDAAADEYGEENLPKGDSKTVEAIHYANWMWAVTVIADKDKGEIVDEFEHDLGRNPYILFEADLLPRNPEGMRWAGLLFHAVHDLQMLDQMLTDLAWVHHEWTLSPIIIEHDPEQEDVDPKSGGRPAKTNYGPGQQLDVWKGEKIERGPVPEIPQQSLYLVELLRDLIEKTAMVPAAERAEVKAGTSNNAYQSQIAVSQRRMRGVLRGMARFVQGWAGNNFRGIYELTKNGDEKVVVYSVGKKIIIGAGAEDVDGNEDSVVAIIDQPIEIDEYTRWLIGEKKVDRFGFSPEQIIEEMGYPNPEAVTKRGYDYRMDNAVFDQDLNAMLSLSAQKFAELSPKQQEEVVRMLPNADPRIQEIVARLSGQEVPNPNGQAEANLLGAQRQQAPQSPVVPV